MATITMMAAAVLAAGATPAAAKLVQFRTPSSNIGCVGETARAGNLVRCDIATRNWSPPRRPAGCTLDWGQGLTCVNVKRHGFTLSRQGYRRF